MTGGAVLGAAGLVVVALAPNLVVFSLGWLLAGLAMCSTFYQPAFAALTRWYDDGRVRALTTLTLAGGLASTVFAPVTSALTGELGWRRATPRPRSRPPARPRTPALDRAARRVARAPRRGSTGRSATPRSRVVRTRPFLLLAAGLTMSGFAMYAVVFGLIPLLTERGASATTAAWALGLGGAGQTLGRLLYSPLSARTTPTTRTAVLVLAGGGTTALLATVPGPIPLLVAVAVLAGMVRGNLTLIQATAVTDRWGTSDYGRLAAVLAAPVTIAGALAPWAGAALAQLAGSQAASFAWLALLSTLAAAVVTASGSAPVLRAERSSIDVARQSSSA